MKIKFNYWNIIQAKDIKEKFKQSYAPLKEETLKGILDDDDEEEFLDDDDVQVTLSSLDDGAIKSNFIGSRKAKSDSEEESDGEAEETPSNTIAGMEMGREAKVKKVEKKVFLDKDIKSERDLKKMVRN